MQCIAMKPEPPVTRTSSLLMDGARATRWGAEESWRCPSRVAVRSERWRRDAADDSAQAPARDDAAAHVSSAPIPPWSPSMHVRHLVTLPTLVVVACLSLQGCGGKSAPAATATRAP